MFYSGGVRGWYGQRFVIHSRALVILIDIFILNLLWWLVIE